MTKRRIRVMKQTIQRMVSTAFLVLASTPVAFANEPGGGYEGISAMYYGLIAVILMYGAYDIFFKKD